MRYPYLDPASDYEAHVSRLERTMEKAEYDLWINETFEFIVQGTTFQVQVDCHVRRSGSHGELEIQSPTFAYQFIHAAVSEFPNPIQLVEDDLRENNSFTWRLIENAVDLAILQFAGKATEDRWETV